MILVEGTIKADGAEGNLTDGAGGGGAISLSAQKLIGNGQVTA
jgi:hypothetical protein